MLTRLLGLRPVLRELRKIREALEMQNRLEALRVEHVTGRTAMVMMDPAKPGAKDESAVSSPDYAFIAKYQSAASILGEQLGREPSEEEVNQMLEGGPQDGAMV